AAFQQPHDDVRHAVLDAGIVNGHNVLMLKRGGHLRFVDKALDVAGILGQALGYYLERDLALEDIRLVRPIDNRHTSGAKRFAQFIAPDTLSQYLLTSHK